MVSHSITTKTVPSGPNSLSLLATKLGINRGDINSSTTRTPPVGTALGTNVRQPIRAASRRCGVHHQNRNAPAERDE